jgi:hypothetical protein
MALDFGENADVPVGGTLVIKSDKLASGFYGLGDIITGTFTARVVDVAGKERLQRASEEFRAQPQQHVALITERPFVCPGQGEVFTAVPTLASLTSGPPIHRRSQCALRATSARRTATGRSATALSR